MSNVLIHTGVKGMKWGRRKATTKAPSRPYWGDSKLQPISNKTLQTRIKRLKLETQYQDLQKKSQTSDVQSKILKAVAGAAGTSLTVMLSRYMQSGADALVKALKAKLG